MAKYSVDTDTMLKIMDDFWSYDDLLKSAENLITAGCSKQIYITLMETYSSGEEVFLLRTQVDFAIDARVRTPQFPLHIALLLCNISCRRAFVTAGFRMGVGESLEFLCFMRNVVKDST